MATTTQVNVNLVQTDSRRAIGMTRTLGPQLTKEQTKILNLPANGHILIKGCAGSGKTLVAVRRAEHLYLSDSNLFGPTTVGIFAYNREIIHAINGMLDSSISLKAQTLDSWLYHYLGKTEFIDEKRLDQALKMACHEIQSRYDMQTRAILRQDIDFYRDEIAWIKGRRISSFDIYRETRRTGRGTTVRVTVEDRPVLWEIFQAYQKKLQDQNIEDWNDRVLEALALTEQSNYVPPFSHIVIDEAQDFSMARITLLSRLVKPETNSITLIADSAQQIYQSGFSWADTGLVVVGHSYELRCDYRNTRQIALAADSLLSHEDDQHDFTTMEAVSREGERPVVLVGGGGILFPTTSEAD